MYIDYLKTPYGIMELKSDGNFLTECMFIHKQNKKANPNKIINIAKDYLNNYFNGKY